MIQIPDFGSARVLVAGDVMLDRYWYGATSRVSPEAPVPVVHIQDVEERPGGASNVAVNAAALGARATVTGIVGDDDAARVLRLLLSGRGVECRLVEQTGRATVTKLRVVSRHQQLIRLDFEDSPREGGSLPAAGGHELIRDHDVLVLSDYAKGALADVTPWIAAARSMGRPVVVDPKGRAFDRYRGATVITPNLAEFESVVGACQDLSDLVRRGEQLRARLGFEAVLVTRSEHGMSLLTGSSAPLHLPAQVREVYDVTGAGDTVVGVLAAALAAGSTMADATGLANLAAGLVVGKLGTASVTDVELGAALRPRLEGGRGMVDEDAAARAVSLAREGGQRIVMTNGCFDILHAGHVLYLAQAKALGDRLLVAVNDDASVQRLKGRGRPINTMAHRMAVLDGLSAVDWVVPFSEDTPRRLICRIAPDILVKGGDYRPEEIAGGDCVRARGGEVRVLPYQAGLSTTAIVDGLNRTSRKIGDETG